MQSPEERKAEAEKYLKELGTQLCSTPTEKDLWDWALWPTLDLVATEDAEDELQTKTVAQYVTEDMIYRLGEQLQDMTMDLVGTPEWSKEKRKANVALKLSERLEDLYNRPVERG